ncbi:unnamed protein product, partial [Porites lobata]
LKQRCVVGNHENTMYMGIAIQVEEVSIESVASNLSNNPPALNAKPDKLRSIKKPTGWNSFLKA